MALDLGQTTLQLLSALDGVAGDAVSRAQRLSDTLERGLRVTADAAAGRTPAVGLGNSYSITYIILHGHRQTY